MLPKNFKIKCQKPMIVVLMLLMFEVASDAYKLLVISTQHKSHLYCMMTLARELSSRGHKIHFLLNDEVSFKEIADMAPAGVEIQWYKSYMPNDSVFVVDQLLDDYMLKMMTGEISFNKMIQIVHGHMQKECATLLMKSEDMITNLKKEGLDMAIVDGSFVTKCYYLLPHRLGIPWVSYTDFVEPWLVRVPWLPSFIPTHLSSFTENMSFFQRLQNTAMELAFAVFGSVSNPSEEILTRYREYGPYDSLNDLVRKSRLFIGSRDIVLDYAKPSMPNMVDAGGMTIKPPGTLPKNIQDFLDGSSDGAIIVTFGTMAKTLPRNLAEKFLAVFGRLKGYRVVWKFLNVENLTIPANVMIQGWLPQQDILGHPKTKLFITHCGNNGQFEAVYHGVPMIGFPMHADQPYNAMRIQHKGYGIAMNIHDFTSDELHSNIMTILNEPSFNRRVSLASEIFRSAPQRPAERAAFWIEHVIEFGSDHLESAGKDLNFFQYFMLDVLVLIVIVAIVLLTLVWKLCFWLFINIFKIVRKQKLKAN